jgi:hypothetical protein
LLKKLLALRIIAVTPHEIMPFDAWLGFHADEIESSNMDSLVQWEKKRRRIVSTGATSTDRGREESNLGQRVETESTFECSWPIVPRAGRKQFQVVGDA